MNPYDHIGVEAYWQKKWVEDCTYRTDTHSDKKTFYGLVEFPYPSGAGLHVGHVRSYTGMDVIVRKRRMEGFETLFPIGWDAFGLPAENYAIKTGIHPSITTRENIDTFRRQLQACGFSFDWEREVDTTDPAYYKWTQWIFLKLYEKGLAYKKQMPVNWCPKDKCVLANEEVVDGKCERCGTPAEKKDKEQWMLAITKYAERLDTDLDDTDFLERIKIQQRNWIGMSEGSEIVFPLKGASAKESKKILIGTRNEAKFKMLTECFPKDLAITFLSLNDVEVDDSSLVEGQDFQENAKKKAEFYFKATGIPTISTDHILWLAKWPKDNGYMIHLRKEANPLSERATDEECITFLKKWVTSVGGECPAHFEYAIAFADERGSQNFVSYQRKYTLQAVQSKTFWEGYPTESLLIDVETGEYKGDQENSFRYGGLISDLDREVRKWLGNDSFTVYTTRADTLFGCTYCVLAPEHALVKKLLANGQITNKDEVQAYIDAAVQKIDIDRSAEGKEKTGVKLEGVMATNPANQKEVPLYIADYVLATYGTGAIMAVPAHDERDGQFAKKYGIDIVDVVAHKIELWGLDAMREGVETLHRNVVDAIITDKEGDVYLVKEDKDHTHLIGGGVENDETEEGTVRREVREETGFTDFEVVRKFAPRLYVAGFRHTRQINGTSLGCVYEVVLNSDARVHSEVEDGKHELVKVKKEDVLKTLTGLHHRFLFEQYLKGNNGTTIWSEDGVLCNSGDFNGLTSAEARVKITEAVGGKIVKKSKLRDWVFARQRYWGEPIPLVYDKNGKMYPVHESELPITLPQVDKYEPTDNGESPLYQVPEWVNVKGHIDEAGYFHVDEQGELFRRETDTMPQWAGSSWYFMRYIDPRNSNALGDKDMLMKWLPVTWYNGGMEHTTLHLLYSRFWYKFLFDIGMTPTSEPYYKRTSQGMILGTGGVKMSKSLGNVINPDVIVKQFGADTLRMYEMFIGPFDQAVAWDDKSVIGIRRFIDRVYTLRTKVTDSEETLSVTHKTIKKVGEDIESTAFNTAISSLMICLNEYEKEVNVSKVDFELFLKVLAPFAPFIAEELWKELGKTTSIHLESWPSFDETKLVSDSVTYVLQINGKVRGEVILPAQTVKEDVLKAVKSLEAYTRYVGDAVPVKEIFIPGKLVNIVI
jgi:leucyl-tRNA synthetase